MAGEQLTAAQRAAVENRGGPLLVSAAAGSGKTKVLVDRLMDYLCSPTDPANVDDFLIITYTRAAASELRGKIAAKLTERMALRPGDRHLQRQLQRLYLAKISTVHAFCGDLLREYAFALDLPGDFRVADENECQALRAAAMEETLEAAYKDIGRSPDLQAFVDTQGFGRDDRAVPEIVAGIYDAARCHLQPESWLEDCVRQYEEPREDPGQTPWGRYLMEALWDYLDGQIPLLRRVLGQVQGTDDLGPKYGPTLQENLRRLEALRGCATWGEIRAGLVQDFGRLGAVRNPKDPELAQRVKTLRKTCWEGLKKCQQPFTQDPAQVLEDLESAAQAVRGLQQLVLDFGKRYRREKERRRVLDFGDLEHRTLELLLGRGLTGPTRAAHEVAGRFREVMVDEYQDTNEVQDRIFAALTRERGNCFMVGDVKQSIYRFRLADPGIFLEKYRAYAPAGEAGPMEGRKILLSENFRSGGEILEAANHVFRCTMCPQVGGLAYGEAEALREGIPHSPLPQSPVELHCIQLVPGDDGEAPVKYEVEARFVAQRIQELLQKPAMIRQGDGLRPVRPGDIVILLRSPGSCARHYQGALEALGIPAVTGAGSSVLESGEIAILRALLQVLDNPLQDIPLEAVLASPVFGFTADHMGRLRAGHKTGSLYEALCVAAGGGDGEAAAFRTLLEDLRQTARLETLARLVEEIYARTHMEALFSAMADGDRRRQNLDFFYETAAAFEQGGRRDLQQFLTYLDTLEDRGLRPEEVGGSAEAVNILSIHKSKGLEYPVVVLANLSAAFNREDLRGAVLVDPQLGLGCSALDRENRCRYPTLAKRAIAHRMSRESVSEELRVLYVAMTRARDMLVMTYASKYLTSELETIAQQASPAGNPVLSQQADCLGHWVLTAAMTRNEAHQLFQEAGRPEETVVSRFPWTIRLHTLGPAPARTGAADTGPEEPVVLPPAEDLERLLTFRYPHAAACQAPSKVTATQLKGRELDQEAADGAFQALPRGKKTWREPDFLGDRPLTGREAGTATHLAMQFLSYGACGSLPELEQELERLTEQQFLTPRQTRAVNRQWILDFFRTDLGRRLRTGENLLREFKFSILEDGASLDPDLAGEQVMLQGVVDCCLLDPDGLTILDFKTDRVAPGQEARAAARYAPQVRAYGNALGRIFEAPVKKLLLYFFRTGTLEEVSGK